MSSKVDPLENLKSIEKYIVKLSRGKAIPYFELTKVAGRLALAPPPELSKMGEVWWDIRETINVGGIAGKNLTELLTPRLKHFFQVFENLLKDRGVWSKSFPVANEHVANEYNDCLEKCFFRLRTLLRRDSTKKEIKRYQSKVNHNSKRTLQYLESLMDQHGSLYVQHLKLGLRHENGSRRNDRTHLHILKRRFNSFMSEKRHNPLWKDDLIGFVWKLGRSAEQGYFYHLILTYEGPTRPAHQKDTCLLKEFWEGPVTGGKGVCYSPWSTALMEELGSEPNGLITDKDARNYRSLMKFLDCLVNNDRVIELNDHSGDHVIGRGHAPKM